VRLAAPQGLFLRASVVDTRCVTDCSKRKVPKTQKTLDICPTCRARVLVPWQLVKALQVRSTTTLVARDVGTQTRCLAQLPNDFSFAPSTGLIHPPSQPTTVVSTKDRCHILFSTCSPRTIYVLYVEPSSIGRFLACRIPRAPTHSNYGRNSPRHVA
jgi:hypothetical protein